MGILNGRNVFKQMINARYYTICRNPFLLEIEPSGKRISLVFDQSPIRDQRSYPLQRKLCVPMTILTVLGMSSLSSFLLKQGEKSSELCNLILNSELLGPKQTSENENCLHKPYDFNQWAVCIHGFYRENEN